MTINLNSDRAGLTIPHPSPQQKYPSSHHTPFLLHSPLPPSAKSDAVLTFLSASPHVPQPRLPLQCTLRRRCLQLLRFERRAFWHRVAAEWSLVYGPL